jgi:hypothetical protein
MRNLSPETFTDPWFRLLSSTDQLLWLGIIIGMADDQGRFVYDPLILKLKIFPCNPKITPDSINSSIKVFIKNHKLFSYKFGANGSTRECLQIVNWWKHQGASPYMAESLIPAPTNWDDRARYHKKGQTGWFTLNWESEGGFRNQRPASPQPAPSLRESQSLK